MKTLEQLTDVYSHQIVEDQINKCAHCRNPATKRCTRCKSVQYCSKDCQIKDYKLGHKKVCKEIALKKGLIKKEQI